MDKFYLMALILGSLLLVDCLLMFATPKRKITLFLKLLFDVVSTIQLLFIYFYNGTFAIFASMGLNVIGILRDIIFMFRTKYEWANHIVWLFIFLALMPLSLIFTYDSWISLLPVIGSIINTTALYLINQKKTKLLTIIGQVFFILNFVLLLKSSELLTIMNLAASSLMFVSCFIGLIVMSIKDKKERSLNENIQSIKEQGSEN